VTWSKKKTPDVLEGSVGPFVVKLTRKADGRWDWKIWADGKDDPLAAGVSTTEGAAKTKCDQFIGRSGRV